MRNLEIVIDTIIKLVPNVVIDEEPTPRRELVDRLEKIKKDSVFIAPENPVGFVKVADALESHLGKIDKKYKEIISLYFGDKISRHKAFEEYNKFYQ